VMLRPAQDLPDQRLTRQMPGRGALSGILLLLLISSMAHAQESKAILLTVSGSIDLGLAPYTSRVLREAEEQGVSVVILRINTPGGRVDAATQMRDALLNTNLTTVAFIDKEAYSAGALIALAAQQIYMTGGAVIGAAAPVSQSGQPLDEKYISAIRKLFRATAEHNGRPPQVAEAMVDADVAIPDLIEKGKLLTLTTQEALQWKVADAQIDTLDALLAHLNVAPASLSRARLNWAEALVRTLTHPTAAALLLMVGMLALIAEFLAPGFGVGGVLGLICLGLLFGSHYLVGLAGWEEALLMGVGIVLLAVEILVLPGFGVAGILGVLALGAGLFFSFLGTYAAPAVIWRTVFTMLVSLVIVALGTGVMLWFLPRTTMWSRLSLKTQLDTAPDRPPSSQPLHRSPLLGTSGTTVTPLLPSGSGIFHGKRLDIISEGAYIPPDTPVTIIRVEGNRLVVRPSSGQPSEPNGSSAKE
jgi:membrane-bound serine protease (ClpP class)